MRRKILNIIQPSAIICSLFLLLFVILQCAPLKIFFSESPVPKENKPFIINENYIQEDTILPDRKTDRDSYVQRIIQALNEMKFPVDSCVINETSTFIKTPFVFKNDYFITPKHQFLKLSLLIEVPNDKSKTMNLKYALCTTCARCKKWYCDELLAWAYQDKYNVIPRVQQLIFDFKQKLLSDN